MVKILFIAALSAFPLLTNAAIKQIDLNNNSCHNDYYSTVASLKNHCIRLLTPDIPKKQAEELVIYLHGDYGVGGSGYMKHIASHFSKPNRMNFALIRPGYFDDNGHFSTGHSLGITRTQIAGRLDNYTRENIDIIADGIANLKQHYQSKRVIIIGHSGGAAIAALILNFHPQLINQALLINCPCDLKHWRPDWEHSLSPIENIHHIAPTATIHILSGAADEVVPPELGKNYAQALSKINPNTAFFLGMEMKHNFNDETSRHLILQHIHRFLDKDE